MEGGGESLISVDWPGGGREVPSAVGGRWLYQLTGGGKEVPSAAGVAAG